MRRLATLILSLWGIALSHAALEIPKALPATDITENSFTANWQSVSQASAYNLNVFAYKMEDCGTEAVKVTESFEGLVPRSSGSKQNKYIDSNLSVFPENWKIDVNTGSIRQLYTTNVAGDTTSVYSGKIALAFDTTGDSIVTPVLPAPASKFSFWIKNANATGTVAVYGFDGFQWHSLGEASTISYQSGGIADFSANIPVGCIQFKMIYTDENPGLNSPTAIDEISYTYGGIVKTRDYLVENKRITETSAPVTGLKDNTDYFYTVKSTNGSETSLESNMIDVFGYAGSLSKPVLKEFTDIKGGQYTANWNTVIGSNGYVVYNVYTHIAQRDETKTILHENFDAFTGGTIDLPAEDDGTTNYDEYTTVPDWSVNFGCWTGGMLSGINIQTPVISTTNTNGCTVNVRVYGAKGDKIDFNNYYSQGTPEKITKFLTQEGYNNLTIDFKHSSEQMYIELYFRQLDPIKEIYLDEFTMTQTLSKGDRFSYNYDYTLVEGRRTNSYTFTDLPKAWGDQFAFRMSAYAVVGDDLYQSQWTELTEVPVPSNIDNTRRENQEIKVISYPGNTIIRLLVPQEIIISDLQGRIVAQVQGVKGDNSISLKQGIYLLRCGNHCQKFICR